MTLPSDDRSSISDTRPYVNAAAPALFLHAARPRTNPGPKGKEETMTRVPVTKIEELQGDFEGEIVLPRDAGYDGARQIWNAMIDKRPAIIARCASDAGRRPRGGLRAGERLLLAVRGGGHNIAGNAVCDDGLVVDLSRMKAARVDPGARRAHRGRRHARGPRRRHAGARPRHAGRDQLHDRHRRADARRRLRLAQPQVRHDRRQPRVRRGRDRGRRGRCARARPRTPISSGRCAAAAATSASSRASSSGCTRSAPTC